MRSFINGVINKWQGYVIIATVVFAMMAIAISSFFVFYAPVLLFLVYIFITSFPCIIIIWYSASVEINRELMGERRTSNQLGVRNYSREISWTNQNLIGYNK